MDKKILLLIIGIVLLVLAIFLIGNIVFKNSASKGASVTASKTDDGKALLDSAKKMIASGDEDGAVKSLEILIAKYPVSTKVEAAYLILAPIYEKRQDLLTARDLYQKMIKKFPASNNIARAQEAFESLNIKILFSPIATQDSLAYEVQKGDTLGRIAKKFNTTIELLVRANGLKDNNVKFGKKLKISKAKFSIAIVKSQNILTLKVDKEIVKTYRVSTGKNSSTPVGTFTITNKLVNPPWYPPAGGMIASGDPKNVLGSRWIGISKPSYGIHGTTDPGSIGKSVTEGCVRMKNSDVEELYAIVPEGTEVVIID